MNIFKAIADIVRKVKIHSTPIDDEFTPPKECICLTCYLNRKKSEKHIEKNKTD